MFGRNKQVDKFHEAFIFKIYNFVKEVSNHKLQTASNIAYHGRSKVHCSTMRHRGLQKALEAKDRWASRYYEPKRTLEDPT